MEITLSQHDINAIAYQVATILAKRIKQQNEQPEMVTTAEAASILRISPQRMRQIADRYPHIKQGENKQGKLLFVRKSLIENY